MNTTSACLMSEEQLDTSNAWTATQRLIRHLASFRDGGWSAKTLRQTELCLLDSLSCYSAGRALHHYRAIAEVAGRCFGMVSGPATVVAPSAFAAAYLYGQAANLLDYDDTLLHGHPGAAIVGAVLSVAAEKRLSTDRLLRGIAAGYEAEMLIGAWSASTPERAALVRSVGVWDTVAASVGICVALDRDDETIERAIGIAVQHSLLPYTAKWFERPVPSLKNNLGWAAAGAVLATELALTGKTGVTKALEGETGMWRMAGSDRWTFDEGLFELPAVERIGFKVYPVCWHLQQYLKAFASLFASVAADDEVSGIVATGPADLTKFCMSEILTPTDSAFSLPAAFSLMISGVEPGPLWAAYGESDAQLRYRNLFRFEVSNERSLAIETRRGARLTSPVEAGHFHDKSTDGLDEAGVLAKYDRLAEPELRAGATIALSRADTERGDAGRLYDAFHDGIVAQLRNYLSE